MNKKRFLGFMTFILLFATLLFFNLTFFLISLFGIMGAIVFSGIFTKQERYVLGIIKEARKKEVSDQWLIAISYFSGTVILGAAIATYIYSFLPLFYIPFFLIVGVYLIRHAVKSIESNL